jgi:hypothetical protein
MMSEFRLLSEMFEWENEKVTEGWAKLRNEGLHELVLTKELSI